MTTESKARKARRELRVQFSAVPLVFHAVTFSTQLKYESGVKEFVRWAEARGIEPTTAEETDEALTAWMQCLYQDGGSRQMAANALFGLELFKPRLRKQLTTARLALVGWAKLEPKQSWPPLTWGLACAIAVTLTRSGRREAGMAVLAMYTGMLRIGEACKLRLKDVVFGDNKQLGGVVQPTEAVLRLGSTKTGPNQAAEIDHPVVVRLLRDFKAWRRQQGADDETSLFRLTTKQLGDLFRDACNALGLQDCHFVCHSCRHGFATLLFAKTGNMDLCLVRGRWAATSSARVYIQSGRSLLVKTKIPPKAASLGDRLSKDLFASMEAAWRQGKPAGCASTART